MKLSLAWIFSHIAKKHRPAALTQEFVDSVMTRLGSSTTEIDSVVRIEIDIEQFACAKLNGVRDGQDILVGVDSKKEFAVPTRKNGLPRAHYLLVREDKNYRYAALQDLQGEKEGLVPEVEGAAWSEQIDLVDYIITIDNKAITHRPDLWGHRGFARELAALFSWDLVPEDELAALLPIRHYALEVQTPYSLAIDGKLCKRMAALVIPQVEMRASLPWMAFRLARVDGRPLHAVVDITNYVMFDLGQPMHAFDAAALAGNRLQARHAYAGERLTLLDGETITLTPDDCVIADASRALALAGIMGGKESGVSMATKALVVEAANFDPDAIRKSSQLYKHRTESSARFEKGLDPNQNTFAVARFVRLLTDLQIPYTLDGGIASLGELAVEHKIEIAHVFMVARVGMQLPVDTVVRHLVSLGFGVVTHAATDVRYTISVPTFRSRDIVIKEDIVEEIARMVGYNALVQQLPTRLMKPFDMSTVLRMRALKQQCAFGLHMHEVSNYAFYDEEWLVKIGHSPQRAIAVRNPVSEHWRRMVTSLVPHLLKNLAHNIAYEQVRLFEVGTTWQLLADSSRENSVEERKKLALLFYTAKKTFDFYEGKAQLQALFDLLGMLVVWRKPQQPVPDWYLPEMTAELVYNDQPIGYAGMISPHMMRAVAEGEPFVVELDAHALLHAAPLSARYSAVSKYQAVDLDISMLVPFVLTIDDLKEALAQADARIIAVQLRDFFESPAWPDKRAVTLRFTLSDKDKTFTKEEIDAIWSAAVAGVTRLGVQIR